ncbi:apolipoprotein N-acyltransferase [Nocardioides alkalitolerans]|uniref:apolipoprotein N-acyltransferase n=1 Tax=Nocardioides alkalitolerans TaxID=281714 RepID=UPI000415AC9C|nr:apolipoprotein N-acyltransferase [Nocardioides alkalitolerans]
MSASIRVRALGAAVAGLTGSLAFEPVGLVLLGPVAVAGFCLSLYGARVRAGVGIGLVFGAAFSFSILWWMRAVGTDAWIALSLIETAYFLALGPVVVLLQRLRLWPVWTAAAWVAYEELRSGWPFGGFPWGRLSFGTIDTPFAALLPWLGTPGVGFVLALLGTLLAAAVLTLTATRRTDRALDARAAGRLALPFVGIAALVGLAVVRPYDVPTDGRTVQVSAVQGDVPGAGDDVVAVFRDVTRNHVESTIQLADDVDAGDVPRPDFVLWPENSTAVDPFTDTETYEGITEAVDAVGVPVVVGGMVDAPDDGQVLNQGIVWDPESGPGDRYSKRHPVPFGEFIPFRNSTLTSAVSQFDLIPRDMLAGTRETPLAIGDVLVGNAICFDVAYDDGFRAQVGAGAQMLTVQTSNAMFIRTHQIDQQLEITRLRAVETGKYLVVAAINGRTAIVAPDGSVVADIDPQTQGVVSGEVVLNDVVTPAMWLGPWLARAATAATLVGLVLVLLLRRRERPGAAAAPSAPTTPTERETVG